MNAYRLPPFEDEAAAERAAIMAESGANDFERMPDEVYAQDACAEDRSTKDKPKAADPLEPIRVAILADLNAGPEAVDAALPPRFIQYPHLPECGANTCAPGETGKTALALREKILVSCGLPLYPFAEVQTQGPCVLVTAEDGAERARYVLQRALKDGIDSGQLTERAAAHAKQAVRIIGWRSSHYGRIVLVDRDSGDMYRAPAYDLLIELLGGIKPSYVTLDPEALFAPGDRFGNDGHAFLASMIHETAMSMQACVQMLDHVSQNVARTGIVDQYASRGGTAKSDEARMVRQLVTVTPAMLEGCGPTPLQASEEDFAKGRILQLHWNKLSWAPKWKTGSPLWLRRRGYWFEALHAPTTEQTERESASRDNEELEANIASVVEFIRMKLTSGLGIRMSVNQVEASDPGPKREGRPIPRAKIRSAIDEALSSGMLKYLDLPKHERQGGRKQYLAPADYSPAGAST